MATPTWGEHVIKARAKTADTKLAGQGFQTALDTALAALRSTESGSEDRAVSAAASAWRAAQSDRDRATAATIVGVGLVTDPAVNGYKERLTDAYGLAAYAGTLDGTVLSQAARAAIAIAVGRVDDGKKLISIMDKTELIDPASAYLLALGRYTAGERNDAVLGLLQDTLKKRPDHQRARELYARTLLQLLATDEVKRVTEGERTPMLSAIRGRALVLAGDRAAGLKLLEEARAKAPETQKGEVLYWLGRSLAEDQLDASNEVLKSLTGRPGYRAEAELLGALVLQHNGAFEKAKASAKGVVIRRGVPSALLSDARWALVNACAGAGDLECVAKEGTIAADADGDYAMLAHARAATGLIGKNEKVDSAAALVEAHRFAPFDGGLALHTKEPAVPGGDALKAKVRAARRMLKRGAILLADKTLADAAKNNKTCRVCRALFARAISDTNESARRAARAIGGAGPELGLADLLETIEILGRSADSDVDGALKTVAKDPRAQVRQAVAAASKSHAAAKNDDPKKKGDDHDH